MCIRDSHGQLQVSGYPRRPHRLPDLSLRGGRRPTWQSREGSYVFAGSTQLSGQVLRDSHVASLLGMTRQASAAVHQCLSAVECSPYWAVTDRRYIFLSSGGLCRDRRCGRNRPIHPDRRSERCIRDRAYSVSFSGTSSSTTCQYNDPHYNSKYYVTYTCTMSQMLSAINANAGYFIRST